MVRIVLACAALLAIHGLASAANADCAFKWPVERERALFSAALANAGGTLNVGAAALLSLTPADKVAFERPPSRKPRADSYGGVFDITVASAGEVQITVSDDAWIDVIQNGEEQRFSAVSGVKACPGIRKSVRFELSGGPATLQISGSRKAGLKVAVLPAG